MIGDRNHRSLGYVRTRFKGLRESPNVVWRFSRPPIDLQAAAKCSGRPMQATTSPSNPLRPPINNNSSLRVDSAPGDNQLSDRARLATLSIIILPFFGLFAAAFFLWGWGFYWTDFWLLVGMYLVTTLGVTVGFHRLFVHRSFETYLPVKVILAVLGSMAIEGELLTWVAFHRQHHQFSDLLEDPHSPHHHGKGLRGWLKGYWHAHIGWFFDPIPSGLVRYVKDLKKIRALQIVSDLFPLWVFLSFATPAILGGLISRSWLGAITGLIWGGFVRILIVHHVTWSVNSACHVWGFRPYRSDDMSRDNFLFGILALGEGWHNTHHAFPTSARHGLRWWQLDASYGFIRILESLGLVWDVKLPTKESQIKKRRR